MEQEQLSLWLAVVMYVLAGVLAIFGIVFAKKYERLILTFMCLGLILHAVAIGLRWLRLEHGPYLTMFEILSSNLFTLMLFFILFYWRYKPVRPSAAVVLPVLFIMMAWMMFTPHDAGMVPASFDTIWLWVHIGFGKVFMGAVLVAVGMGGIIVLRQYAWGERKFSNLPSNERLDDLAFRFMAVALIFDSLMLIAGALWAHDAWGRYWGWDPLETWAFITWLVLVITLHLRSTFKLTCVQGAYLIFAVFSLGFLTFYGVPFISNAPHQGTFG
jgi:ABC-type transport system involved in cytochrome c biogenesis permease subunit